MIAVHFESAHQCLRTLLNVECDEQVSFLTVIIVVHRRCHLCVAKAVREIQAFDRIDIRPHQRLAETPARRERSSLKLQPSVKQLPAEVLVPIERHGGQTELVAPRNFVADHAILGLGVLSRSHFHIRVEISFALEEIADVAAAFLKQVLIHRALSINGKQLAKAAFADARAGQLHSHVRAGRHVDTSAVCDSRSGHKSQA